MANKKQNKFSGEKIHKFCIDRWEFYKKQDGAYLPSKHDKQVFEDASNEFGVSAKCCEYWFNKIEKPLAEKMVKESIYNGNFMKLCEDVLVGNGESPWGLAAIIQQFYLIIFEIMTKGIKQARITVSKNANECCSSGHYLTEMGFSNSINIKQYENGNIGLADDDNNEYVFEVNNIKSVMCKIVDSDNMSVVLKKMFKLLMKNGNIVTMYFDFKED